MRVRGVVFDLDGVLMDSEPLWYRALAKASGAPAERVREVLPRGLARSEWTALIEEHFAHSLSVEEIQIKVMKEMMALFEERLPFFDGARETVHALAQTYPLALATNSDREVAELFLRRSGLGEAFAAVVTADDVPRPKPYPDIYLQAAKSLGVWPGGCLAVEDSALGMRAARSAGYHVALFHPDGLWPEGSEKAATLLRELSALLPLLQAEE